MPYDPIGKSRVTRWFWAAAVFGLFAVALLWFVWDPFAGKTRVPSAEPTAQSTEWTTAPEGPKVEVDLPDTPVKAVPAESPSPTPAPATD